MNENYREFDEFHGQTNEQLEYSGQNITFMSILLAVLKRPYIVVISMFVILAPLIYYLTTIVPMYMSSATMMVSVKGVSFLDVVSIVGNSDKSSKTQKYYTSILDSREYRDDIVNHVLSSNPTMSRDSIEHIVKYNVKYLENPREEGFLTITAISQQKEFALFLAKAASNKFQDRSINLERQDAETVSKFIDNQLSRINQKMENAEEELQNFLRMNKFIITDTEMGVGQELTDMEKNLSEAEAGLGMVRMNIESYEQQINEIISQLSSASQGDIDQEDIGLKRRLELIKNEIEKASMSSDSAEVIESLRMERNQILSSLVSTVSANTRNNELGSSFSSMTLLKMEKELETALLEEERFSNQVNFYRIQIDVFMKEHPDISKDILEYIRLVRAREVLRKTVDILLEKHEEIRIRVASENGGVKLIDRPRLAEEPIARKRYIKLILGVIASLGLGVLICVIIDRFDDSIKDENEVQQLGLPVFGTIPVLTGGKDGSGSFLHLIKNGDDSELATKLLVNYSEKSPIAEAYRSLKTSLSFIAKDKSKKIFVITSPSSSEGKSLSTGNLDISFAQGGYKVLIVDCDLRRATQHKYFDFERKPGLIEYLFDEVSLTSIIKETSIPNLSLITSGSSPPNPAEMINSKKMTTFLNQIREQFDIIFLDTPPIMACVDSRVLAKQTDGMILIAKVESTSNKALLHSYNLAKRLNVEILGVILNHVESRYGYGYYYAYRYYNPYSYYSSYSYYYQEDEEKRERVKKKRRLKT